MITYCKSFRLRRSIVSHTLEILQFYEGDENFYIGEKAIKKHWIVYYENCESGSLAPIEFGYNYVLLSCLPFPVGYYRVRTDRPCEEMKRSETGSYTRNGPLPCSLDPRHQPTSSLPRCLVRRVTVNRKYSRSTPVTRGHSAGTLRRCPTDTPSV